MKTLNRENAFISRINKESLKHPIEIDLDIINGEVYIIWFQRNENSNPGDGGKFLHKMCEFADQMGVVITLQVSIKHKELVKYYEKFDFVQDGPPLETGINMYRFPSSIEYDDF